MGEEIKGTETIADPATERTVITDESVLKSDDLTTAVVGDADVHDPPARSALPDEPVADAVGAGQGAHTPPDPAAFDPDGRPRAVPSTVTVSGDRAETSDDGSANPDDVGPVRTAAALDGPAVELGGSDAAPDSDGSSTSSSSSDTGNGAVPDDVSDADPAELAESHSGDELRAAAAEREVSTSGNKLELAERIIEHDGDGGS